MFSTQPHKQIYFKIPIIIKKSFERYLSQKGYNIHIEDSHMRYKI